MKTIPPKWMAFAADLLELASDKFSNAGCNDIDVPEGWTDADAYEFGRAFEGWNSEGRGFDPDNPWVKDYAAMSFLAHLIREATTRPTDPGCRR